MYHAALMVCLAPSPSSSPSTTPSSISSAAPRQSLANALVITTSPNTRSLKLDHTHTSRPSMASTFNGIVLCAYTSPWNHATVARSVVCAVTTTLAPTTTSVLVPVRWNPTQFHSPTHGEHANHARGQAQLQIHARPTQQENTGPSIHAILSRAQPSLNVTASLMSPATTLTAYRTLALASVVLTANSSAQILLPTPRPVTTREYTFAGEQKRCAQ